VLHSLPISSSFIWLPFLLLSFKYSLKHTKSMFLL
jgi:hypothetical protein